MKHHVLFERFVSFEVARPGSPGRTGVPSPTTTGRPVMSEGWLRGILVVPCGGVVCVCVFSCFFLLAKPADISPSVPGRPGKLLSFYFSSASCLSMRGRRLFWR